MGAFVAVIVCLIAFSWGLYQLLKITMSAYQDATGTTPTVRSHAPWLRSMRGERPEHHATGPGSREPSGSSWSACFAAAAFEIWFFFFSGSSIGGGGGPESVRRRCTPRLSPHTPR